MKFPHALAAWLFIAFVGPPFLRADEARASVYIVDKAKAYEETGGACLPYAPGEFPLATREILGIAKGPPGSTLVMMAFDRDAPHLGLAPVVAEQTADSKPARFPAEGSSWPYDKAHATVDLYIAVFDNQDPELAKISEYSEWLAEALAKNDEVTALLHAEVIQKRFSNLLRQRNVEEYRVKFGDGLTSLKAPPSAKAAVTRGTPDPLLDEIPRLPSVPIAAVRRGLAKLDEEWREDSRAISFAPGSPGILVFPVSTPIAP
ncbi:MAG: hypothetical protein KDN18_00255 [Verrucomicrobiae bacterium]|nr:hypothetical protein [Verrucomicrobiae bacterium]